MDSPELYGVGAANGRGLEKGKLFFFPGRERPTRARNAQGQCEGENGSSRGYGQSPAPKRESDRRDSVYKLPLFSTVSEQDATEKLRESPDWPSAERKIVVLLNALCVECVGK